MSLPNNIQEQVADDLAVDIGSGDVTSALIPEHKQVRACLITREPAVICGQEWVNQAFAQVDRGTKLTWLVKDGERVVADQELLMVEGSARSIVTAERVALNWLQTLSGTATTVATYTSKIAHTNARLLDTRKTIPQLRLAQKYAVTCGGGYNHRLGLYDLFLIKENHIMAAGSITAAVQEARALHPELQVEVEVETLTELKEALAAGADIIMLDNFSMDSIKVAVNTAAGKAKLEVSGNVSLETIVAYAETGVDFISVGALTKALRPVDLSLRVID